jgi:hypothetical protein
MATTEAGFLYGATEEAASFLDVLETPYLALLKERAAWLVSVSEHERADVRRGMMQITQNWLDGIRAADRGEAGAQ